MMAAIRARKPTRKMKGRTSWLLIAAPDFLKVREC
jgi:hypothetical protein